jgi:hypothetical protein
MPNVEPRRRLRIAITAAVYAIFFGLAVRVVRGDVVCDEEWCIYSSAPYKLWFIMPIFPALAAWFGSRRLLDGPAVARHDLMLFCAAPEGGWRDGGPQVGALLATLGALGYATRAFVLDDRLSALAVAAGPEPLLGPRFLLMEGRSRARRAFLRLMLFGSNAKGGGVIEVSDTADGLYQELATYIVRALTPALPDLRFRRYDSSLPPERARDMVLPARPARNG